MTGSRQIEFNIKAWLDGQRTDCNRPDCGPSRVVKHRLVSTTELTCGNRYWLPKSGRPARSGSRVWGEAAIEVVGTVTGYMLGKLDKPKKRKPPG